MTDIERKDKERRIIMSILNNDKYIKADITGYETEVEQLISEYIDSIKGETEDEQRKNLLILKKDVQGTIDFIMSNRTTTDYRADGYAIRPILKRIINVKINELPPIEDEELI